MSQNLIDHILNYILISILPTDALPEWLEGEAAWTDWTEVPAFVDIDKISYLFIRFKNATDCIKYCRIQHNGRDIGPTIKDKVQLESYLLNVMRPKSDKENKANSFTLWEDAHSHSVSVCEQYINMWDIYQASLTGENSLHVTFPVIIGFDDLLPFQNFSDFPSCVLGDFKLYIRVSPDVLVWCLVNLQESIKQMAEVCPFTENSHHEIFNYKQSANILSSTRQ
jgi:hypothetical protein